MLEIRNLTKIYKDSNNGIENISLTVEDGDIFGFIGQNGAGKTTTIKAVVGIHDFDSGEIRINGMSVKEHPVECKQITAYIPDNPDLYEYLSGIDYLNFIGDMFCVEGNVRTERISKYAEAFGITKSLGDPITSYSHGMKQKLAIISALIHAPKFMVMDEPFVGLDPKAAYILKELMHDLAREGGAIFFSTHVLDVAEKLCDKVAIIKQGKLIEAGTMEEVKGNSSLEEVFLELTDEK